MDKPAATATLTMDDKKELFGLLTHLGDGGVSFQHVATATGINYKSFINKFRSLVAEMADTEGNNRNRFTRADYEAIKIWWAGYRDIMYSYTGIFKE